MGATTSIWVCPTTKHFEVPTMMMMSRRKCLRKKRGQNLRNFRVSYFFSKKKAEKKKKRKKKGGGGISSSSSSCHHDDRKNVFF
tara:strand:- start:207 stop:458 length:252 start_codon:yes stop_codon:yes gene_type:complete